MKPGYYWIEHEGNAVPALFDGEHFHVHGHKHKDKKVFDVVSALLCPAGCICTTNSDGSVTVNCKPNN